MKRILSQVIKGLRPILSELGLKHIDFRMLKDESHEQDFIGLTWIDDFINISKDPLVHIYEMSYRSVVIIFEDLLEGFVDSVMENLDVTSDKIAKLLLTICLENVIIHELRHLFQFETLHLSDDDLELRCNEDTKKDELQLTRKTLLAMESDAIEYTFGKSDITSIKDKGLKKIESELEYYNNLCALYEDLLHIEGMEDDIILLKRSVNACHHLLKEYIDKNY